MPECTSRIWASIIYIDGDGGNWAHITINIYHSASGAWFSLCRSHRFQRVRIDYAVRFTSNIYVCLYGIGRILELMRGPGNGGERIAEWRSIGGGPSINMKIYLNSCARLPERYSHRRATCRWTCLLCSGTSRGMAVESNQRHLLPKSSCSSFIQCCWFELLEHHLNIRKIAIRVGPTRLMSYVMTHENTISYQQALDNRVSSFSCAFVIKRLSHVSFRPWQRQYINSSASVF